MVVIGSRRYSSTGVIYGVFTNNALPVAGLREETGLSGSPEKGKVVLLQTHN